MNPTILAALKVPGPTITALSAPFWRAAEDGRLVLQSCEACGRAIFYPRGHCPHCWNSRLSWREASGKGRLKSYSTVFKPSHPGWLPAAPYTVGLVELEEGPTMLTLVVGQDDNAPPPVGAAMRFSPTKIGAGILPCFASAQAGQENPHLRASAHHRERSDNMTEAKTVDGWRGVINGRPNVGDFVERSRRTRAQDIAAFTEMTGDRNPLHYDKKLADASIFGKLIVQGGVTSGILNALVAEDLPGPGTVFLGVEWKFLKAVGVDELITGRVEIKEVRADKPICKIDTSVRNEAGEVCLSGSATVYTVPLAKT